MCMTRFDYNIALSLGLMLFLELHQNDYFDFFRPVRFELLSGWLDLLVLQLHRHPMDIHGV